MQIYKFIAYIIFISGVCGNVYSANASIGDFIQARGGTKQQVSLADQGSQYKGCFPTSNYLICLDSCNYPGITNNANARYAILQGLNITIKKMVYNYALEVNNYNKYKNRTATNKAIMALRPSLAKIEFLSGSNGDWAAAVVAIKRNDAEREIGETFNQPDFKDTYCNISLSMAKHNMLSNDFKSALKILLELYKLGYTNIEAYILTIEAFIAIDDMNAARKLADEIWETMHSKLNADYAEKLGDIFQKLGEEKSAINAYNLASSLLTDHR